MSNFHLQEIETLQNSLREREEYVSQLENRLRALWDKCDGDRKHYMERIKRLEEAGDGLLAALKDDLSEYVEWINESTDAVGKWNRAKESKQ